MKKILATLALVLAFGGSNAEARDFSKFSTTPGKDVNVRQNEADTLFVRVGVDRDTITLERAYRSFMLWCDSDFLYNVDGQPTAANAVKVKAANGYFLHIREFNAGTQLFFDVLPEGANDTGEVVNIYGIAQRR